MPFQNLLLIDDDAEDCELFGMALDMLKTGAVCEAVSSAVSALELLDRGTLVPEVIFVDLNMPIMTGEQFLAEKQKRQQIADIPVYVLTTSSDDVILSRARKLGAKDAFAKPNTLNELKELIASIIS